MVNKSWGPNSPAAQAAFDAMNRDLWKRIRAAVDVSFEEMKESGIAEAAGWEEPADMVKHFADRLDKKTLKKGLLAISKPYW